MLISTKYEEIYAPEIKDFVYVSDYAYTANEVLECEADILMTLDFNVTTPSPLAFLDFYLKFTSADVLSENITKFLLDLSQMDLSMSKHRPSILAASALYFALS